MKEKDLWRIFDSGVIYGLCIGIGITLIVTSLLKQFI